ncbi:dephospho-CoA kinase [Micromonospora pattaloongensis]|uniref:Dephospho-CoA kinase n=2 Tax=Micromonospora pattaloongensis TaxID=405436 RepID=A0A1H3Q7T9_9ACTN|nr:dephospho-CoA kinase [Micromonospora pattaloongensis]
MVGLTGGIGAGKSAVAARLAANGAVIVDSDRIAREVVRPGTDGLREIVATFGAGVLAPDGTLDRPALAAVVFGDDSARRALEAITHPRVRARSAELVAAASPDAIVVNDVPLLVEVGLAPTYHLVVVVEAGRAVRLRRLVEHRGMTEAQAYARIAAQAGDAQRRAVADVLLRNDGSLGQLEAAVDATWRDRLLPCERNVRDRRPAPRPAAAVLADPDPGWPEQFARLAARIRYAVGADRRVEHIGSTAVPGLPARDVLDVQLGVASLDEADALAETLAAAGLPPRPRRWFDAPEPSAPEAAAAATRLHGNADPARPVNLHLRVLNSPGWRYALLLRDYLRADPEARAGYLALKRNLVAATGSAESYAAAKEPWFDEVHPRAERWAAATGWGR